MHAGFLDLNQIPAVEVFPGCRLRTPHGNNLMLSYLEMDAGAVIPSHSHPHEQAGILLQGKLDLTIDGETQTVEPGAMFLIPGGVEHMAVANHGPVVVLDVFSPVREDYAELMKSHNKTD
ncbi:cupin domain-containing protein [Thalassoglobus sp. JC818]|uniref:cupin domain-containing protein n=1 Tax=Thalassoglobus sp. JC818 TaxID=3232136 RepID=UPI0034595D15